MFKQLQVCRREQPLRSGLPMGHSKPCTTTTRNLAQEEGTIGTHAQPKIYRVAHKE